MSEYYRVVSAKGETVARGYADEERAEEAATGFAWEFGEAMHVEAYARP